MTRKVRLDELLVERGLFESIHDAQAAVLAGEVVVGEHRETSAGLRVSQDAPLRLKGRGQFVSRGGEKLAGALEAFAIDLGGLVCADLGASSGGFTDCMLKAGAARVSAIDVAYGQFSWELRCDQRVELYERTNVRGLDPLKAGGPFDFAAGDLSFVSLASLMPSIAGLLAPKGSAVLLVKPQFELDAADVADGGIVRDSTLHAAAVESALGAARACGLVPRGLAPSPIAGAKGNREFLLYASRDASFEAWGSTMDHRHAAAVADAAHATTGALR